MNGCFPCQRRELSSQERGETLEVIERKGRDEEITAYVLTIISLVLFILCCILLGVAHLSPEFTMGFGFIPYLLGGFAGSVAGIILIGALAYFAVASVHDCQALYLQSRLRND